MIFADLPVSTKFVVEDTVIVDYFTKVDEARYTVHGCGLPRQLFWNMDITDEVYPLLEWEDEL